MMEHLPLEVLQKRPASCEKLAEVGWPCLCAMVLQAVDISGSPDSELEYESLEEGRILAESCIP
jgi:hypothetical protein